MLAPVADAYVRGGTFASTNFGTDGTLVVKQSPTDASNTRQTYLRFDLSAVNSISSAKLRLFGGLTNGTGAVTVAVTAVPSTTWVEGNGGTDNNPAGEIRDANKPAASGAALATRSVTSTAAGWYEWDLTAFLQAQKAAGKNLVSVVLTATAATDSAVVFNSRDAGANRPSLVVTA